MAEEKFETNLMRMIAAELYFSLAMQASRELYGKNYFSLGVAEKALVDQLVRSSVAANYQAITPELLTGQTTPQAVGFQAPAGKQEQKS